MENTDKEEQQYCRVYAVATLNAIIPALEKSWPELEEVFTEEEYHGMLVRFRQARRKAWKLIHDEEE